MHTIVSLLAAAPGGTPLGDWLGVRHNEVQAIVDRFERHAHLLGQSWSDGKSTFLVSGFWPDGRVLVHQEGSTARGGDQIATAAEVAELVRLAQGNARHQEHLAQDRRAREARKAGYAAAQAERAAARPGYEDFLSQFSPMQRGKLREHLDGGMSIGRVMQPRVDHAYDLVRKGFTRHVQRQNGEWCLEGPDSFYLDKDLGSKTLVDLVLFLANQGQEGTSASILGLTELPATAATVTDAPIGSIFVFNFPGNTDSVVRTPAGFAMPATSESAARYQGSLTEWTTLFNGLMGTKSAGQIHVYRAHPGNGKMLGKAAIERIRDEALAKLPEIPDLDSGKTRSQEVRSAQQRLIDEVVALYKEARVLADRVPSNFWAQDLANVLGTLRDIPGQEFYREPPRNSVPAPELTTQRLQAMIADLKVRIRRLTIAAEAARPVADVKAAAERELEQARAARAEREAAKQAARVAGYRGDIPWSVAGSSHGGTSHVPDERGQQELDSYQQWLEHVLATLEKYAITPEARARVPELFAEYRAAYRSKFVAYLSSHAQVVSSMVAGGSNFPVARMQKRGDAADKRRAELLEWRTKALSAAVKALTATNIEATGGSLAEIERNIMERLRNQERYKAVNTIVKGRGSTEDKLKQIVALGVGQREAQRFLVGDDLGRKGVPSYALQNNLKEIRRLEARLEEEREKAERADAVPGGRQSFPFDGGTVEYDHEDDRLRIRHDAKPPGDVIAELRSRGFKWSPSNTAWQRQLTENAVGAARAITKADLPWLKP